MPGPYSPELADTILAGIGDGLSLNAVCQKLELRRRTVRSWLEWNPEFAERYEITRKCGIDAHVDQMLALAERVDGCESHAQVQAARLRIDMIH